MIFEEFIREENIEFKNEESCRSALKKFEMEMKFNPKETSQIPSILKSYGQEEVFYIISHSSIIKPVYIWVIKGHAEKMQNNKRLLELIEKFIEYMGENKKG